MVLKKYRRVANPAEFWEKVGVTEGSSKHAGSFHVPAERRRKDLLMMVLKKYRSVTNPAEC